MYQYNIFILGIIPDTPLVPATDVDVNKDEAEEALQPRGDEPSPDELDEAVDEDEADRPTLGRPNSPFPPSDNGRPEPIMVEVVIEPKPEDSLRLPFDKLSLLASHEELFPPTLLPIKIDERTIADPEETAAIPPLKLSLSKYGVGEVGPPKLVTIEESPTAELALKAPCITDCNISQEFCLTTCT